MEGEERAAGVQGSRRLPGAPPSSHAPASAAALAARRMVGRVEAYLADGVDCLRLIAASPYLSMLCG